MKTRTIIPFLTTLFIFALTRFALADDGKFVEAMKKNIQAVYTAQSIEELQRSVNAFNRISDTEKKRWEPLYYAAWGNIMMANREQTPAKKDQYLDLADAAIEKAKTLQPGESELVALEGFVLMIRVSVDPAARGAQFAGQTLQTLNKAVQMNSANPRALALLAKMQFSMAQFMGSSTAEACANASRSVEKFAAFTSDNALAPQWGKGMADEMVKECQ
jgi:hypothetical protein